jgi:Putative restriction endonuclease
VSVEPVADWRLPEGGITAANLDHLPGLKLPAHTELIDGGLFFPGPQRAFHTAMAELMEAGLNATRPDGFVVQSRTPLALDLRTKVRPDILVAEIEFPAEIESEPALDRPSDPAEAVRLAVEADLRDS